MQQAVLPSTFVQQVPPFSQKPLSEQQLEVAGMDLLPQIIKAPSQLIVSRELKLAITERGMNVARTKMGDMFTSIWDKGETNLQVHTVIVLNYQYYL